MGIMKLTKPVLVGVTAVLAASLTTSAFAAGAKPVYFLSKNSAVNIKVISTVGDSITGTVVRGIPDGMGLMTTAEAGLLFFLHMRFQQLRH